MIQRKFIIAVFVVFVAAILYSQSIDEPEIRSVNAQDVEFVSYSGPYAVINSIEQIRTIGADLGRPVNAGAQQAGAAERYQIFHIVDPSVERGFDADILILGANAGVDHIRNLRRIISSYLISAYSYQTADADALAVFVTVYNAVYRSRLDYFLSKYKPAVTGNLTAAKVGLALNYAQWPGGTQIVIPLSTPALSGGGLPVSAVDTSLISDSNVIESLRKEDDRGVDDRKQMVDIKEREADRLQENADREREQRLIEEEKLETEREEAQQVRRAAEQAREEAAQNPNDPRTAQKAEEAEQQAVRAEEKAAEQERVTQAQVQKADEAQQAADTKREEAAGERKAIAQDQADIIAQVTDAQSAGVYGLHLVDGGGLLSTVVKVSNQNGAVLKESPVRLVRARTMFHAADGIIAIAGENVGNRGVRLVILDLADMEIVRQSEEAVSESSILAVDGSNNYYVVIKDGAIWALGKYNAQLQLQQKSTLAVNPSTPIIFTPAGLIITGADGATKLLKLADLTEMK
jgi:hypothetical protein